MSIHRVVCKKENKIIGTFSNYNEAAKAADKHEQEHAHRCIIEVSQ